jgi:hypothetical protein
VTFKAVFFLLPPALSADVVLVGGVALLLHKATHRTEDVDFVGSDSAIVSFIEAAKQDRRFSVMGDGGNLSLKYYLPGLIAWYLTKHEFHANRPSQILQNYYSNNSSVD